MDRTRALVAIALATIAAAVSPAGAQSLQLSYEHEFGAYGYRFENPSTFDTAQLVAHFFEQKYDTNNDWLVGRVVYGQTWRATTEAAIARDATRSATDFDTFFDPTGDVITSGTSGDATLRSWRVRQTIGVRTWRPASAGQYWYGGYSFRRDRAEFGPGNKSVTHTSPPSTEYSIVTTRETTDSDVHEILVGVADEAGAGRWTVAWNVDAVPATFARLTVLLPDKYPGQPLRFMATSVGADAELRLRRRTGPLSVEFRIRAGGARSYRHASEFSRHAIVAGVGVSW